jgi:hypothetical protein
MRLRIRHLTITTMTDVDRLLREYIERFESGGSVDPGDLLSQTEGKERSKLSALIEGYLEHEAPPQEWDPKAFEGSLSERAVARLAESWSAASGELPSDLVALRNARKITRAKLVQDLADSLGVSGRAEKVAAYYHQLENGRLPTAGISSTVFDALADLLGTTTDKLRAAGEALTPASGQASPGELYARKAQPPPEEFAEADTRPAAASPGRPGEEWDEVDELFRGGH